MVRRKNDSDHGEENSEAWLLPYSDLMTLLLAVFIVLFAVSNLDAAKAQNIADAFRGIFTSGGAELIEGGRGILDNDGPIIPPIVVPSQGITRENIEDLFAPQDLSNLENMQGGLLTYFAHEQLEEEVSMYIDERGLVISLTNSVLFDAGSAQLKPESLDVLRNIGGALHDSDNYIRIEGHTDNTPIRTAIYPSNWELSSARASSVVKLLVEEANISPDKLVIVGYGEYKPIADNNTAEGRAENRRVDIIVLNMKYSALEEGTTELR